MKSCDFIINNWTEQDFYIVYPDHVEHKPGAIHGYSISKPCDPDFKEMFVDVNNYANGISSNNIEVSEYYKDLSDHSNSNERDGCYFYVEDYSCDELQFTDGGVDFNYVILS